MLYYDYGISGHCFIPIQFNRDLGNLTPGSFTLHNPQSQQETTYDIVENIDYEECDFYESIDPNKDDEQFEISTCPAYESVSHK